MAKYPILKAVEFDKTSAKFRKQYGNVQALVDSGHWMIQPKYDGCFVKIHLSPGGSSIRSRTDEPVRSMNHIGQALLKWFGDFAAPGPVVVLGEAWAPHMTFPQISGAFRQHGPAEDLHLVVNDLLPSGMVTDTSYVERFSYAAAMCCDVEADFVYPAMITPTSGDVVAQARRQAASGGYDGLILRRREAGYSIGDAKNGEIVKVKPTLSLDLLVVGVMGKVGEKTGRRVFTLTVAHKGVWTDVGSGVPHVLTPDIVCGGIAEIECLGVTAEGKLREPRFKGMRHDKVDTDG